MKLIKRTSGRRSRTFHPATSLAVLTLPATVPRPMSPPAARPLNTPQPFLVALAAWALPGLGYVLIGQRTRGLTVGISIVLLFVFGMLIGGARALEVPMVEREDVQKNRLEGTERSDKPKLIDEIRSKPWSIAQVFTGPVGFLGGYVSAWAGSVTQDPVTKAINPPPGVESHARVNEIAVLYMAVAGMLNLLAIIDSAHRAGRLLELK